MTKSEKETVINFDEDSEIATIYSASSLVWNKCKKLGLKQIESCEDSNGEIIAKTYQINKKLINFRKLRVLSDSQREKLQKRAEMMRKDNGAGAQA